MIGCVFVGIFGFIYFALLDTESAGVDLYRHRAVVAAGDDAVRPRGGADRGKLLAAAALQRLLARLPARLDHRRRPVAVYRDSAVRHLSFELADRPLHSICAVIGIVATALLTDYTNKDAW